MSKILKFVIIFSYYNIHAQFKCLQLLNPVKIEFSDIEKQQIQLDLSIERKADAFVFFPTQMNKGIGMTIKSLFDQVKLNSFSYFGLEIEQSGKLLKRFGGKENLSLFISILETLNQNSEMQQIMRQIWQNSKLTEKTLNEVFPNENVSLRIVKLHVNNGEIPTEGFHRDTFGYEYFVSTQTVLAEFPNGSRDSMAGTIYRLYDPMYYFKKMIRLSNDNEMVVPTGNIAIHAGYGRTKWMRLPSAHAPMHTGRRTDLGLRYTIVSIFQLN